MGLHGEELRNWADKKLEDERQAKKEEREALKRRIKEERGKIQEQAALAREQSTLAEKQLELERLRSSNGGLPDSLPSTSEVQPNRNAGVKSPRLPLL